MGRTYDDDRLRSAVSGSRSWRGVLRELGLAATSSASIRSVRLHVERLGLDTSHFTGQRRWTDASLIEAVAASRSWTETGARLGLAGGSSTTLLKGHAARLELDTSHFTPRVAGNRRELSIEPERLPRAGSMLAAAWLILHGYDVSWPLEPCRYDLLATRDGRFERVQVKTTRLRSGSTWLVRLSTGGSDRIAYDPDEIDSYVVIDGDLGVYRIPIAVVGGLRDLSLAKYEAFRLATTLPTPSRTEEVLPTEA